MRELSDTTAAVLKYVRESEEEVYDVWSVADKLGIHEDEVSGSLLTLLAHGIVTSRGGGPFVFQERKPIVPWQRGY